MSQANPSSSTQNLESALSALSSWFTDNMLSLNPEKSGAILLGSYSRNRTLTSVRNVDVSGSSVSLSDSLKLLGITFDSNLTFRKHVNLVSQSCFYHIKALRHIRHSLDSRHLACQSRSPCLNHLSP